VNPLPDKSSRRHSSSVDPTDDAPTRIVLGDDPSLIADSHTSTVEFAPVSLRRDSAVVVVTDDDRTIISKRGAAHDSTPSIHVGPLESRKSLEGETLDYFKLESYVGGGGMGAVYRAQDTRLNRLVAVKILSRDQSDSETVRRFRNEAQSAARLDHPNIARVYYVGEDKGWNFIAFEFIEGVNLRDIVEQRGPLPFDEALNITLQVAQALEHAAARDVVHRDIKPSNVLLTPEGSAKLVDMGLARLHQVESSADDLTQSGVTLGTFDYISPEQARDPRLADVRSDIYSLGCTFYYMLVGRPPFPEGTALQKLLRHNGDDPPDVRLFRPDTSEEVVGILTRALAKKPDQRFQTPAELIAAIHRVSQRLHLNLGHSSPRVAVAWPVNNTAPPAWWWQFAPLGAALLILLSFALLPDSWSSSPATVPTLPAGKAAPLAAIPPEVATSRSTSKEADSAAATPDEQSPNESRAAPAAHTPGDRPLPDRAPGQGGPMATAAPAAQSPTARSENSLPTGDKEGSATTSSANAERVASSSGAPSAAADSASSGSGRSEGGSAAEPTNDAAPRGAAASSEATTAPNNKRRIVVRTDTMSPAETDALTMTSLPDALRYAALHEEVDTIDLAFSGKQVIGSSLDVASRRLTIKAPPGFTPELVLRPSPDAPSAERRLIRQLRPNSSVTWEGVRLRFEVPAKTNWALFEIAADAVLTFEYCSVAMVDPVSSVENAALAFVQSARADRSAPAPDASTVDPQLSSGKVVLRRSLFRGNGTLLQLSEDVPIHLDVSSSFVATNKRLLETSGLASRPQWMERVRVTLENSTIHVAGGLVLLDTVNDAPHRMELRIDQQDTVIFTDRSAPLIEYRGGTIAEEPRVSFEGMDNYYPRTETFFRHRFVHDGIEQTNDFPLGDLPRWAIDRNADKGVTVSPTPSTPIHEHTANDYLVTSAAGLSVGCSPAALPPENQPRRPANGSSGMDTMKMEPRVAPMPSNMPQ
jgi:serine/threonine protein kinase